MQGSHSTSRLHPANTISVPSAMMGSRPFLHSCALQARSEHRCLCPHLTGARSIGLKWGCGGGRELSGVRSVAYNQCWSGCWASLRASVSPSLGQSQKGSAYPSTSNIHHLPLAISQPHLLLSFLNHCLLKVVTPLSRDRWAQGIGPAQESARSTWVHSGLGPWGIPMVVRTWG